MVWEKGQSGNPKGRPKESISIVSAIKEELAKLDPKTKKQRLYSVVDVIMEKATKDKDVKMLRDLINRIDGLPQAKMDITSGNKPIPLLYGLSDNNSNEEDSKPKEED